MHMRNEGFTALIAVVMLSIGAMVFSLAAVSASYEYAGMTVRREMRIQKNLNNIACRESAQLMLAKDVFLTGTIRPPEFNCTDTISYP